MAEKCFCHLGGYSVKDATARKEIEELKKNQSSGLYLHSFEISFAYTISAVGITVEDNFVIDMITNFSEPITKENVNHLFSAWFSEPYGQRCLHHKMQLYSVGTSKYILNSHASFKNKSYPGDTNPYLQVNSTVFGLTGTGIYNTYLYLKNSGLEVTHDGPGVSGTTFEIWNGTVKPL